MKRFIAVLLTSLAVAAHAADITGAGATFPYPIYAKWAEAYKKDAADLDYVSLPDSLTRQIRERVWTQIK
jgi:phosphate transport system substrate-binding protein